MQQPSSIEQDSSLATEAPAIDGRSAIVNWWEWDASKIERLARAIVHQVTHFLSGSPALNSRV
jgi:hypothetical protein